MAKVKVWNRNKHPHKELFKGTEVVIPAGGFVEMEFYDAVQFKGQYTPLPPEDFSGDPSMFFKMIDHEWPADDAAAPVAFVNPVTGQKFETAEALAADLQRFSHLRATDPEADALAKGSKDAKIADLEAQVARLASLVEQQMAQTQKKGPGRPPKGGAKADEHA